MGLIAVDWKLIVAVLAAIAGWAAFFVQRQQLWRNRSTDQETWYSSFVKYRRGALKPLAETIRSAYSRLKREFPDAPSTWEEAVHRARYPSGLPVKQLEQWHAEHQATLDGQDEFLMKVAEYIYPPCQPNDERPLKARSPLSLEEYDAFDGGRAGVADYFDLCARLRIYSSDFARFLEERVRPNHYPHLKLVTYLELAYVRGLGQGAHRGPGKVKLFELGTLWSSDDPRKSNP